MTTCIIIEDDRVARESLKNLIHVHFSEELMLVGIAGSLKEGLNIIQEKSPELIFLDVELPDENGFGLFNYYSTPVFDVIFTTTSTDYAIPAIKHMALDYIIKPINLLDLRASIVRLEKKKHPSNLNNNTVKQLIDSFNMGISHEEKIALPTSDGFQVIRFNEILYCQASENYSYIHTTSNECYLITKTLKSLEELLPSFCFFRIHKSNLLNINYVKSFSRKEGFIITLETGQKFEVATRRQEEFINLFLRRQPAVKVE